MERLGRKAVVSGGGNPDGLSALKLVPPWAGFSRFNLIMVMNFDSECGDQVKNP